MPTRPPEHRDGPTAQRPLHRLLGVFARPGVPVLLFFLGLACFNWPLLSAALDGTLQRAHFSLLAMWTVFVALLWLITRALTQDDED